MTRSAAKARTRELLLAAAAQVFAEHGYAGASVDEIAAQAGYTIGALYSHFSGKDELFLTLFDLHAAGHLRDIEEIIRQCTGDPSFSALGDYLATLADNDSGRWALESEFRRHAMTRPELMTRLAQRRSAGRATVGRFMAGRRSVPVQRADEDAALIIALLEGLLLQRRLDPSSTPPELFAEALRRFFPPSKWA
ncbi:TetR/AcrR family transcriptional regulator [Spongiactinospora sp. TRM90649]|uniref:TetR/AcrR family transcriptional regulator n=1 Tax=Spongiactinospora sp. TRM90649 TaxID=3031114 RepID=UPI0023F70152|nr:TetR/AcrR family transcriptional regulator [Spongiactinospora sp. TRM90649]MDF5758932.1 TetR family transcriptional regulator [Spongiactinospora sp. TRM90649]